MRLYSQVDACSRDDGGHRYDCTSHLGADFTAGPRSHSLATSASFTGISFSSTVFVSPSFTSINVAFASYSFKNSGSSQARCCGAPQLKSLYFPGGNPRTSKWPY